MLKKTLLALTSTFICQSFSSAGSLDTIPLEPSSEPSGLHIGAPNLEFFTRPRSTTVTQLPNYFIGFAGYQHKFEADYDDLDGNISSDEFSLLAPLLPVNYGDWHLISFLYYTNTQFETNGFPLIPESNLHSINLPIALLKEHGHRWISGAFVMPSWNGDFEASDNDGIAAAAGVGYVFNPDFRFLLGAYYSEYFGNDFFIPAIQLIYRPCTNVEAYILGPIAGISYSINDDWFVGTNLRFSSPTWKVEADSDGPERTINATRINWALRTEHRLYKNIWGSFECGYTFGRQVKVEDIDNNTLQESDIEPGPFVGLNVNYRF